jgi:N-acetylmuramic acid 6-phosphate etherase
MGLSSCPVSTPASHPSSSALPPDRAHIATEQRNPHTLGLHRLSVAQCVQTINQADAQVIAALQHAGPALTDFISAAEPRFLAGGRLIYFGAGTSGRLGVLDASEAPPTFQVPPGRIIGLIAGGDSALRISSEGREDEPDGVEPELRTLAITDRDTLLGIAAGGTTPYVQGGVAVAKRLAPGCLTGMLVCSAVDKPAACDHLIVLPTGPEVLTGSTRMKAGTATKLALNTISTTLMIRSGRVYQNLMVDLRASNAKLRDRAARIVTMLTDLPRENAFSLLDSAAGSVKCAVLMHRRSLTRDAAEAALAAAGGRLDVALGETASG